MDNGAKPAAGWDAVELGVLDDFVGYHLRRASAVFAVDFKRVVGKFGMRQVPFAVLTMVGRHPGINQGAIGEALGIQRANMVALIGDLVGGGLIERRPAADDRRAFALFATVKGQKLIRDCVARLDRHEEHLLADFTVEERQTLVALLARIEAKEG